jgi:hypothetical protein
MCGIQMEIHMKISLSRTKEEGLGFIQSSKGNKVKQKVYDALNPSESHCNKYPL